MRTPDADGPEQPGPVQEAPPAQEPSLKKGELVYVFVDESGDVTVPGTEDFFSIAAVAFHLEAHRTAVEEAIAGLRNTWNWGPNSRDSNLHREFKFAKLNDAGREKFFIAVSDLSFSYASCLLPQKQSRSRPWTKKAYVYEQTVRETVEGLRDHFKRLDDAQGNPLRVRVFYDEQTDPVYQKAVRREFGVLRSKDGRAMLKDASSGRSRTSNLLQLADLVAGAARWKNNDFRAYITTQCLHHCAIP